MNKLKSIFIILIIIYTLAKTGIAEADVYDAIKGGRIKEVKSAVNGSDDWIHKVDGLNQTLLHHAVKKERPEIVKFLVEKGFDINARDKFGNTPLQLGAFTGNEEIMTYLINRGADTDYGSKEGYTLLHVAAMHGFADLAKLLIEKGVSPNSTSQDGETPQHFAARKGKLEIVKLLVSKGAELNTADKKGMTPLHYSAASFDLLEKWKGKDVLVYLVSKGAKVNLKDKLGNTPLHYIANSPAEVKGSGEKCGFEKEHTAAIRTLIERGADPGIPNNDLKKAFDLALELNHREAAEAILKYGTVRATRNNLVFLIPLGILILIIGIYYRKRLEKKFEKTENQSVE